MLDTKKLSMKFIFKFQNLEERLARRRQLAEFVAIEKQQDTKDSETQTEIKAAMLKTMVDDGKIMERQKQELLDQYDAEQEKIRKRLEEGTGENIAIRPIAYTQDITTLHYDYK